MHNKSQTNIYTLGVLSEKDDDDQYIMKQVKLTRELDHGKCVKLMRDSSLDKLLWNLHPSWGCAQHYGSAKKENFLCKGDGGAPLVCQEFDTNR